MIKTLKTLALLCAFRGSPEHLPYKKDTFVGILVAHALFSLSVYSLNKHVTHPFVFYVLTLMLQIAVIGAVLHFKKILNRWMQIAMAFLGVDLIFYAMVQLLSMFARGQDSGVAMELAMMLGVWRLFIDAYLFTKCFDWTMVRSMVFAFAIHMLQGLIALNFFNLPEGM